MLVHLEVGEVRQLQTSRQLRCVPPYDVHARAGIRLQSKNPDGGRPRHRGPRYPIGKFALKSRRLPLGFRYSSGRGAKRGAVTALSTAPAARRVPVDARPVDRARCHPPHVPERDACRRKFAVSVMPCPSEVGDEYSVSARDPETCRGGDPTGSCIHPDERHPVRYDNQDLGKVLGSGDSWRCREFWPTYGARLQRGWPRVLSTRFREPALYVYRTTLSKLGPRRRKPLPHRKIVSIPYRVNGSVFSSSGGPAPGCDVA